MNHNLFAIFQEHAPADGAHEFTTTVDGRRYSYAQAFDLSARLATVLRALGVEPGDRVAVQVDKSPETIILYLACLRVGAAYLPLNTAYTETELNYFLGDAQPTVFVCRPANIEAARELAEKTDVARVETLGSDADGSLAERATYAEADERVEPRTPDDLAAILYTSGTTGRSKGAMLTHGNLRSNAESLAEIWRFNNDDRLLHALPIFHTHGLFVACNVVLMAGAAMVFLPKFDAEKILALLPECSVLMGVPTFYTRLLAEERLNAELTRNMRLFTSGSAPLTAETHQTFAARTGHAILERYGMTETNMNTSNPYDGERIAGTVGLPLPGVALRVADRNTGEVLPGGSVGVLEVNGSNVFQGYWRMPEKTTAEFREDGFFITGDLARIDEQGYVQIVGRDKDLVISGGYNVYPKEVEQLIDELPDVVESAVVGLPHTDFGEAVTAVIVAQPGAAIEEAHVTDALQGQLARYKQPKRVLFIEQLPRNVMGKVQKSELRERFKDLYTSSDAIT